MTKEALKLALEALESCDAAHITDGGRQWYDEKLVDKAITAIKEALANEALEKMAENARELGLDYEPAQKPCGGCKGSGWVTRDPDIGTDQECFVCGGSGAYPKEPEQEPVVCDCDSPSWCKQYKKCNRKMLGFMPYVAQPQRTWVGLTDGEVDKMILLMGFPPDWITENAIVKNIVRNLEAKLKEKNT